jgi:hypothetical protein
MCFHTLFCLSLSHTSRHRPKEEELDPAERIYKKQRREMMDANLENAQGDRIFEKRFLERGITAKAPTGAVTISGGNRYDRLKVYEELLKQFKYGRALDAAIKVLGMELKRTEE